MLGMKFDRCYLTGSCALGTETEKSDIDILLISNSFLFPNEKQHYYLYDITKNYNNSIHLHFMSVNLFNKVNPNNKSNNFSLCNDSITNYFYPIFVSPKPLSLPPHRTV